MENLDVKWPPVETFMETETTRNMLSQSEEKLQSPIGSIGFSGGMDGDIYSFELLQPERSTENQQKINRKPIEI